MRAMRTLNAGFAVFSLIWLIGHSTVRMFDWEFWFALAFLTLCITNVAYLARSGRRASSTSSERADS